MFTLMHSDWVNCEASQPKLQVIEVAYGDRAPRESVPLS